MDGQGQKSWIHSCRRHTGGDGWRASIHAGDQYGAALFPGSLGRKVRFESAALSHLSETRRNPGLSQLQSIRECNFSPVPALPPSDHHPLSVGPQSLWRILLQRSGGGDCQVKAIDGLLDIKLKCIGLRPEHVLDLLLPWSTPIRIRRRTITVSRAISSPTLLTQERWQNWMSGGLLSGGHCWFP